MLFVRASANLRLGADRGRGSDVNSCKPGAVLQQSLRALRLRRRLWYRRLLTKSAHDSPTTIHVHRRVHSGLSPPLVYTEGCTGVSHDRTAGVCRRPPASIRSRGPFAENASASRNASTVTSAALIRQKFSCRASFPASCIQSGTYDRWAVGRYACRGELKRARYRLCRRRSKREMAYLQISKLQTGETA